MNCACIKGNVASEPYDTIIQSFVVKIWLEEAATKEKAAVWRGRIIHVPSGERRFFKDWNELSAIMRTYFDPDEEK